MTHAQPNPADDITQQEFQIGKWTAKPFTLHTAILLEKIDSPFMKAKIDPETGKPVPVIPTLNDVAEALYIILNWHKPTIHDILSDPIRFSNEIGHLAGEITMREMAVVTQQLNAMMSALNKAVDESGIPKGDEKKEGIGSSAS